MKIRSGFVSSSSSSSFIIGLGRVTDKAKAEALAQQFGASTPFDSWDDVVVAPLHALISECNVKYRNGVISHECDYSGHMASLKVDLEKESNDLFIFVNVHNNEGDFSQLLCAASYDGAQLPPEYFGPQEVLISLDETHGVKDYDSVFGATRNG